MAATLKAPKKIGYRRARNPSPPLTPDARTRITRRVRNVEQVLRAEVEKLRGAVTVYDDIQIGNAATLYVQAEIAKSALSRGQHIDSETLTRCLFGVARALRALGLRETILTPPAVSKPVPSLAQVLRQQQAAR